MSQSQQIGTITPSAPATELHVASRRDRILRWEVGVFVALLLVLILGGGNTSDFLTSYNIDFRIVELTPTLLMALPMTLLIVAAEIDLSVASMLGLSSALMGELWQHGWSMPLVVITCLVLGIAMGALNGFLITVCGLPALAVTIGTLALYRGLAYVVLGSGAVSNFPVSWETHVNENLFWDVPAMAVLMIVLIVGFGTVLHATPVGRTVFAMGANAEGAQFAGIPVRRTKFMLYVISGLVCAGAGILYALHFGTSEASNGTGLELVVVTAALLGGVSIFGGVGSVFGVVCAACLLEAIQSILQLHGVNTSEVVGITGLLLIISVLAPNAMRSLVPRVRMLIRAARASTTG